MDEAVRAAGLVVERGGKRVLHGIDCVVPAGRVTGLLGPSGGHPLHPHHAAQELSLIHI